MIFLLLLFYFLSCKHLHLHLCNLADAFIQSDLQCIQAILGIEPTTFCTVNAMLLPLSHRNTHDITIVMKCPIQINLPFLALPYSTEMASFYFTEKVKCPLNNGGIIGAVWLEFKKVFDPANHIIQCLN